MTLKFYKTFIQIGSQSFSWYFPNSNLNIKKKTDFFTKWTYRPTYTTTFRFVIILTEQSSEADAMILSLNGFHFKSKICPVCPITLQHWKSMRPAWTKALIKKNGKFTSSSENRTWLNGITTNAVSATIAKSFGLTAQKLPSFPLRTTLISV